MKTLKTQPNQRPESAAEPAILLVHGAWHGAWCWELDFAPHLRELGLTVETLDLPGHGSQTIGKINHLSLNDYVDAIEAKLESMAQPTVVVGHSLGGYAVQKLMERRPAQLAAAVLMAPATPDGVRGVVSHLLTHRPGNFMAANLSLNLKKLIDSPQQARALFHHPKKPLSEVAALWEKIGHESYRAFLDMLMLNPTQPKRVDPTLPVWIIGGEVDAIFPPKVLHKLGKRLNTNAKIYPDTPHNMMQHATWQAVANDLAKWVKQLQSSQG